MVGAKTGTRARHKPGGRIWIRGHGEGLLTGLLLTACSTCFPIAPRTTSPEVASLTEGWVLTYQSSIIKMPYRSIWWLHLLSRDFPFPNLCLCPADKANRCGAPGCYSNWTPFSYSDWTPFSYMSVFFSYPELFIWLCEAHKIGLSFAFQRPAEGLQKIMVSPQHVPRRGKIFPKRKFR